MAYIDQFALAQDANMQKRVAVAVTAAALQIQGEDPTALRPQQYIKRQSLSRSIILDPTTSKAQKFTWLLVCANSPIVSGTTDANLLTAVASIWDDVAGVTAEDLT